MTLGLIDILGYAASAMTLATFAQQTMLPMRILAIAANVCFIGYGAMGLFMPVLTLHLVLLPINLIRLHTLLRWSGSVSDKPVGNAATKPGMAGFSSGLL
jgi:CRP/FNR family cyclic AMP-dependent transcriptional regulator